MDPSSPPRAPSWDDRHCRPLSWSSEGAVLAGRLGSGANGGPATCAAALSPPGSSVAGAAGATARTGGDGYGVVRGSRSEWRGSDEATWAPIPERPRGEGTGIEVDDGATGAAL
ncbi:hypothetical protein ACHAWF_001048 [Thalassiosira exigua]